MKRFRPLLADRKIIEVEMGEGNRAPLSWPHPGFMLSLDFPIKPGIGPFLDGLDERVLAAGGRLYFAKDSRAKALHVSQMYPRLDEWRAVSAKADPDDVIRLRPRRTARLSRGLVIHQMNQSATRALAIIGRCLDNEIYCYTTR